jgi:hypothetical protein
MPRTSPFVGRREELAKLTAGLLTTGGVVALLGEAGVGKSRLLAEATQQLQSRGLLVLTGQGLPLATGLPLMPVQDVLRVLVERHESVIWAPLIEGMPTSVRREIGRLLPETADSVDPDDDGQGNTSGQQERLFYAVRRVLRTANERHRLAVVIEDIIGRTRRPWTCSSTYLLLPTRSGLQWC